MNDDLDFMAKMLKAAISQQQAGFFTNTEVKVALGTSADAPPLPPGATVVNLTFRQETPRQRLDRLLPPLVDGELGEGWRC